MKSVTSLCSTPSSALLFLRDDLSNKMIPLTSERLVNCKKIYALLRFCGGGKGGFRKQLEKKGREFARAKRMKEKGPKFPPKQVDKIPGSGAQLATQKEKSKSEPKRPLTNSRELARQGVTKTLSKIYGRRAVPEH